MPRSEKRDFVALTDFSREELDHLFALAERLKKGEVQRPPLAGQTLAMLFAKRSTRTRVSFEVGAFQLGAHALFLSSQDLQLGRGETIADTARVLSRYVDGIMIRTFAHSDVEELAKHSTIPVINGLTDLLHPCQLLADLMTAREEFGPDLTGLTVAWVGDGNNMANSWLNAARIWGFELRVACPEGYDPDPEILRAARDSAPVAVLRDPAAAVEGAHVVSTDVWASMGQESETEARMAKFAGYCVTEELMAKAESSSIFLHCLPAHRGEEVEAGVIDGPHSRVWDEAENRLHAQKALLVRLMAEGNHG
ncbi:MAG: ornithine carbamoyltransferase [Gemmatimonas sp. SG8_38_2]|nr:MAG: ornithine carbamoyltransferase [Gemmatimonas sp. SG8_38_2]